MTRERASGTTRIAIAGGGVAAVEAMLALSDLGGPNAEIDVFSPRAEFLYRPLAVTEPFGLGEILRFDLDELARECGASFHRESVRSVESDRREIGLHDGSEVGYDHLLVATGTKQRWVVPGASTFWAAGDEDGVTDVIERLRGGEIRSAIFTMPSGSGWPLPVYELALLTAAELARANLSARLVVVTPEEAPLQLFGVRAAEEVADYLTDHGVEVITGAHPVSFDGRELAIAPGDPIPAEAVVSMPRLEGRCLEGLPHDSDGFIPIDDHCRVNGCERVFAAGDVTTFPVKQGGIAAQQADTAAETIAAESWEGPEPAPFHPVLRGKLLTGEQPRFLTGALTGGQGETSEMSEHPLWQPQGKILGQRLTPFLSKLAGRVLGGEIEEDGETSTVDLRPIDSPPGKGP